MTNAEDARLAATRHSCFVMNSSFEIRASTFRRGILFDLVSNYAGHLTTASEHDGFTARRTNADH